MRILPILGLLFLFVSCSDQLTPAADLIDRSQEYHGQQVYETSKVLFIYRDKAYVQVPTSRGMDMYRTYTDTAGVQVRDIIRDNRLLRTENGQGTRMVDSVQQSIKSSINSVFYFNALPFKLDDQAVIAETLPRESIHGIYYDRVLVHFDEEGGGEDHEDVFLFWLHPDTGAMDYLAYSYCELDCGLRFRESVNRRIINGLVVQDYKNYTPEDATISIEQLGQRFADGELELLSMIENKAVQVIPILD